MKKNHFISGEFNLVCDICSKKIKAHESKHRWDGFITCVPCWEPRHEQDFVKAKTDKITIPFQRPNYNPEYYVCTLIGLTCITNNAIAGCAISGKLYAYER